MRVTSLTGRWSWATVFQEIIAIKTAEKGVVVRYYLAIEYPDTYYAS